MSRAHLDADDAASLLRELAWLRKRGGFTAARLVRAPIVDEVLRGSLEDSFEQLRHRFVSAIHSLSESGSEQDEPLVGVLLAAFALSPETAGSHGDPLGVQHGDGRVAGGGRIASAAQPSGSRALRPGTLGAGCTGDARWDRL